MEYLQKGLLLPKRSYYKSDEKHNVAQLNEVTKKRKKTVMKKLSITSKRISINDDEVHFSINRPID